MANFYGKPLRPVVHHHVVLKPHHKWIIGGVSGFVVIGLIVMGVLMYTMFVRQELNYNLLNNRLVGFQKSTQNQIDEMSGTLLDVQENLEEKQQEIDLLKASAGEDFSGIIDNTMPSVLIIRTDSGQGTGFVINDSGYVITNAHVLADETGHLAAGVHGINNNGERVNLEFIGYSNDFDIAVLKTEANVEALELGNSDETKIGEKVIAIGNPYGLRFSVSEGIISATDREGPNGVDAYLQIDAPLNPGNSGGPLIDKTGKVIGMNNFKIASGESLGFALESQFIKSVVNKITVEEINQTIIN